MKQISCAENRFLNSTQIVGDGCFAYRVEFTWAKWPEHMQGLHAANGDFDREGNLLVATDSRDNPVVIFDAQGNYQRSIGQGLFQKAHSIYITPRDTILVADSSRTAHVVREIDRDGGLVRDFGQLGTPGGSGYDFDYLKVLEAEGRVPEDPAWQTKAAANARLDSIRRRGRPFCRPCEMVMDENGEYFAADGYGNCAVHKFSAAGEYVSSFGAPGREPGQFRLVHGLCLDRRGRIWVADRENSRVQIFSREGELLGVIDHMMRIGHVCCDGSYAYIGELDGGVTIVDMEFQILARFGYAGSVLHAHGLTVDSRGNLYVFTNKNNKNSVVRLKKLAIADAE